VNVNGNDQGNDKGENDGKKKPDTSFVRQERETDEIRNIVRGKQARRYHPPIRVPA